LTSKYFAETYDPTIEDTYRQRMNVDGKPCMLEILDTAGQEEYQALRDQWISGSEGAILVYSISSRFTFDRVRRIWFQVQQVKGDERCPILLVGNKSDRVTEREVSTQEGFALARELGCEFTESSAKNMNHIERIFRDTVREVQKHRRLTQLSSSPASSSTNVSTIQEVSSHKSRKRDSLKSIIRRFSRSDILIPVGEGNTEEGRLRLTTRLIEASRANREKEVRACLAAGAYPDGQPGVDGAALHAASASGHVNIVALLLRKGAAVNALYKGPSGVSALQLAAAEGHASIVRLLLHKGAQIEQASTLHGTALCAAVSRACVDVVRILLEKGANVNAVGGPYGNPLQAAAWVGNVAIVEALHRNGADINARGEGNCTALQVACYAGNAGAARSLLVRGASVDAPGGKYGRAMEAANTGGHFEVVKLLLQYGASFDTILLPSIGTAIVPDSKSDVSKNWPLGPKTPAHISSDHLPDSNEQAKTTIQSSKAETIPNNTDYRYHYTPNYRSTVDMENG
jgi:GTPase KRas protein